MGHSRSIQNCTPSPAGKWRNMSLAPWLAFNARIKPVQAFDTVELDPILVLEGEAAEEAIVRHYTNSPVPFSQLSKASPSVPESSRPGERPYSQRYA
jgi:hypothetical protein